MSLSERLHRFWKWLNVSSAPRRPARRAPRLEALERRELLSGNTAGYVLHIDGSLWQTTSSGAVQVDAGVKDYTAPWGTLYDLHSDGRVFLFSPGNSNKSQIYS